MPKCEFNNFAKQSCKAGFYLFFMGFDSFNLLFVFSVHFLTTLYLISILELM